MNLAFTRLLSVVVCLWMAMCSGTSWAVIEAGRRGTSSAAWHWNRTPACGGPFFTRHGLRALILAKFVPGLGTLAPALAGLFGIGHKRFLLYNGLGAVL